MDMNTRLAQISEVMADAFYFVHMQELVERMEAEALESVYDDLPAQKILDIISQVHRLCMIAKRA